MTRRPNPIARHRLLSDGRSSALITPAGEIDWWCWPRAHSRPLCWSLLDCDGAAARWRHGRHVAVEGLPAGTTARTTLRVDAQLVEVCDALLPGAAGGSRLVRLLRGLEADLDVEHELALGGFDGPPARWSGNRAHLAGATLWVHGGETLTRNGTAVTRLRARCHEWTLLSISPSETHPDVAATLDLVAASQHRDRARVETSSVPRQHAGRARAALAVLHALTDRETGAVIASPTTSLPETVGGDRQFDYRYSWLRDSSMSVTVALLLGHREIAARYLEFIEAIGSDRVLDAPVRDADGSDVPVEREVAGVEGWFGSRPIRVGNEAAAQVQFDAPAFVVDAIFVHSRIAGRLSRRSWEIVRALADRAVDPAPGESHGIWELRKPADLVSADVGRWLTLDRALRMARRRRPWTSRRAWRTARDACRRRVLAALRHDGSLPTAYGDDRIDASGLLAVTCGLLPSGDPRAVRVVRATLRALAAGPFLYRYPPDGGDGFAPDEAPFVPASWWAVTALAAIGAAGEARRRADELCATLPELLSEEFDPVRGEALGNAPLLWSHAECARALFALDEQRQLRNRVRRFVRRHWSRWQGVGSGIAEPGNPDTVATWPHTRKPSSRSKTRQTAGT